MFSPPTAGIFTPLSNPPFTKSGLANTVGRLKQDLRYSPSDCFETFPFPKGLWQTANPTLADHRRTLPRTPPRPHAPPLARPDRHLQPLPHPRPHPRHRRQGQQESPDEAEAGYQGILELRRLHRELDEAIRAAYGWSDLDLGHDFHEVETLPENDRVRYTISPAARKEVLRACSPSTTNARPSKPLSRTYQENAAKSYPTLITPNTDFFNKMSGRWIVC